MPSLNINNLTLKIAERTLCESLSFEIQTGQCWGILGKNGVGKTTLLHTLADIPSSSTVVNPQASITLNNISLKQLNKQALAQQLGILLQDFQDIFPSSVLDTALIGRHPHLKAWQWPNHKDYSLVRTLLTQMGLADYEQRNIASLSGGERRRLGLVTLLAQQTDILLLDEPVNHLDIAHQHQLLNYLTSPPFKQQHAIAMVMHDINLAKQYCDHILLIYEDGKTRSGKTEAILTAENLTEVYGYPITELITNKQSVFVAEEIKKINHT